MPRMSTFSAVSPVTMTVFEAMTNSVDPNALISSGAAEKRKPEAGNFE